MWTSYSLILETALATVGSVHRGGETLPRALEDDRSRSESDQDFLAVGLAGHAL